MIGIPTRACRYRDDVPSDVRELFFRIEALDPDAMSTWRSDDLYTFCVMSRQSFERASARFPDMYRAVNSAELRAEARRIIAKYGWPLVNVDDPDAVLVLAPAY